MKKFFTSVAMALCMLPLSAKDYTCPLTVNLMGIDMPVGDISVTVDKQPNGKYTLKLINFDMAGTMPVGNIVVEDVEPTVCGNTTMLNAQKTIQITAGEDRTDNDGTPVEWMGPSLGDVTILFKGQLKGEDFKALLNIPVAGEMIVGVKLGDKAEDMCQLPNAGFEDFHDATYEKSTSREPNGWHSFMSATGLLVSQVANITHTWESTDIHEPDEDINGDGTIDENDKGTKCVKVASAPVKKMGITFASANGTITTGRLKAGSTTATDLSNCAFLDLSKTDKDGNDDPFYAVLNNKPDAITAWVKYHAGEGNKNPHATISAIMTNGDYAQDPEDKNYESNIIARANKSDISDGDWRKITVPFTYDNDEMPKAALVTLSTCNVPSGGSRSEKDPDVLYVDDIKLVYKADFKSIKLNGEELNFDEYGEMTIDGYTKEITPESFVVEAEGVGAFVTKKITVDPSDETTVFASITVTSNDLKNSVVRTITFENVATGIKNTQTVTLPNGVNAIYNLAGQQVSSMTSGQVYIVKTTDGKTKKMIKK